MFSFSRDFMCKKADEVVFLIQKSMSPKNWTSPQKVLQILETYVQLPGNWYIPSLNTFEAMMFRFQRVGYATDRKTTISPESQGLQELKCPFETFLVSETFLHFRGFNVVPWLTYSLQKRSQY